MTIILDKKTTFNTYLLPISFGEVVNSATLLGASSSEVDSCGGGDNWILPMADFNFPMAFPPTRWTWIFDSLAEKNFRVLPFFALYLTTGFPCLIREFGPPESFFWVVFWHVVMASVMLSLVYYETSKKTVLTCLSTTYFAVKYTFSGVLIDDRRGVEGKIPTSKNTGSGTSAQCFRCLPTCQARKVNFISNSSLFFCLVILLGLIGSFLSCIHFEMEPLGRRVSSRDPNPLFFLDYTESLGPLWNVDKGKDELITIASDMLFYVFYETFNGRVLTSLSTTYFAVKYTVSGVLIDDWKSMKVKIPKPSYLRSHITGLLHILIYNLGLLHIPIISCSLVVVNIHEERGGKREGIQTGVEERIRFLGSVDLFQIASTQIVTKWSNWYQQRQVKCRNWFLPNLWNWNLYFAFVNVYFLF